MGTLGRNFGEREEEARVCFRGVGRAGMGRLREAVA